jgi:hypothetical protein
VEDEEELDEEVVDLTDSEEDEELIEEDDEEPLELAEVVEDDEELDEEVVDLTESEEDEELIEEDDEEPLELAEVVEDEEEFDEEVVDLTESEEDDEDALEATEILEEDDETVLKLKQVPEEEISEEGEETTAEVSAMLEKEKESDESEEIPFAAKDMEETFAERDDGADVSEIPEEEITFEPEGRVEPREEDEIVEEEEERPLRLSDMIKELDELEEGGDELEEDQFRGADHVSHYEEDHVPVYEGGKDKEPEISSEGEELPDDEKKAYAGLADMMEELESVLEKTESGDEIPGEPDD